MISHETLTTCPHCGYDVELSTGICQDESQEPIEGSVSLCIKCGKASVFTDELRLRKPTEDEYLTLSLDWRITQAQIVLAGVAHEEEPRRL
jgi:hypothetical protein